MIGLFDHDLVKYSTNFHLYLPNLDLMKLYNYYKNESEFCVLLNENTPDKQSYDKIYYMSEIEPQQFKICKEFRGLSNTVFEGPSFSNGRYVPPKDVDISKEKPNINIYRQFLQEKNKLKITPKEINDFLDCGYYRARSGDKILDIPPTVYYKRFYIYDTEWFFKDSDYVLKTIKNRSPSSIHFVHPITCQSFDQYMYLRTDTDISRANTIYLAFDTDEYSLRKWITKNHDFLLNDVVGISNIYIPIGSYQPSSVRYYYDLVKKINLLYTFWANKIRIKVKYIPYPNNSVSTLLKCFEAWANGYSDDLDFLHAYRTRTGRKWKELKKEITDVYNYCPEFKNMIQLTYDQLTNRGYWNL